MSNNAMPHTSFDYLHESGRTISEASLSDLPRIREAGTFDVVGESYYGQSFTRIASSLSLSRGQECDIEAVIAAEPDNSLHASLGWGVFFRKAPYFHPTSSNDPGVGSNIKASTARFLLERFGMALADY